MVWALLAFAAIYRQRYWHEHGFRTVESLGTRCRGPRSIAHYFVRCVGTCYPSVTSVILGASRPEQLADTLAATDVTLEDELKKQFEDRTGYANYYFNRENTQRVWKSLTEHGDFAQATGQWTISGQQIAAVLF